MKLHLPSLLRKALLSCMAAVASLSTTVASGVISGGVVAWAISQAAWADNTYKVTGGTINALDFTTGDTQADGDGLFLRAGADAVTATITQLTVTDEADKAKLHITGSWNNSVAGKDEYGYDFASLTIGTLTVGEGAGATALFIGDSMGNGDTYTAAEKQYVTINALAGTLSTLTVDAKGNLTLGNGTDASTFAANAISVADGGTLTIASGSTLDLTSFTPANAHTGAFLQPLTSSAITTAQNAFIKVKFGSGDQNREVKFNGALNNNFEFDSAFTFHGGGSSQNIVTLGSNVVLKSAHDMRVVSQGTFIVDGGTLDLGAQIHLGHESAANGGHFGKLVMNSGSIKTSYITFYNAQVGNTVDINGGTLEFTGADAIKCEGTNTATDGDRVTINIDDATLKAVSTSWTLDGKSSSYAAINNTIFDAAAGKMITLTNVALGGAVTKQGAGELKLGTVAANLTSLDIQNGFVSSAAALNLAQLTLGAGAGFAYDLSSAPALVSADSFDGAITLHIRNAVAGESIALFQGAAGLQKEDVSIVGVSDRLEWDYEVTNGLVALTIADGTPMDLTWDTAGPGNVWASSGDANWDAAGSDVVFLNGDSVTFAGTDADGAITISGAVAPNNVTVSGTGYVFEGGSIAATGKLTVAENADLHLKSQASFAGGVEVGGKLTITDNYTTGITQSQLGTISGAGNVDLYLTPAEIGFDFSGMTGGTISVKTGHLDASLSTFSSTSATLPSIELANSTMFVFNADKTVANDIVIADNANITIWGNGGTDGGALISGDVTGGTSSTISIHNESKLALQGTVSSTKISLIRGGLILNSGADVTVDTLMMSDTQSHSACTLDVNNGAVLKVNGTNNQNANTASLLLAHWPSNSTLNINGGELRAENTVVRMSHDGTGTLNVTNGGTAYVKGINFNAKNSTIKGHFALGAADGEATSCVTIGSEGIAGVQGQNVTVTLGNGTLGATADWEMTGNGTVNLVGTTGTTFNTAAYTVKIAPTLSGTGKLIKTGSGTLEINAAATLADVNIKEGFVQAGAALTLTALAVTDGAGFAYDLSTTPALITAAAYNGKLTMNLSNATEGDYTLFQGAADLNKDNITLLGLDSRMSATTEVVNGLLSIHVQAGGAKNLAWDTAGASDTWSTGGDINWDSDAAAGADSRFYDGDSVTFAGTGEEITISGDVAPATVTVSGTGYKFIGTGKMTGTGKLTVDTNGSLEIAARQEYTGGTVVNTGGTLKLGTYVKGQDAGKESYIRGDVSVYGELEMIAGDVTGWGASAQKIDTITAYSGGKINVNTTANQTGAGLAIKLQGGTMTGIAGSNFDLGYGGTTNSVINALAAEGASSDAPTVSNIDTVSLTLRQYTSSVNVAENAKLCISSVIKDRTGKSILNDETDPGSPTITKLGSGELVLSGANTYTYATTVQAGTLTLADGGVLNSAVTVDNGATFKLHADTANVTFGAASISGEGAVIKTGSKVAQFSAASTLSKLDIQQGFVQAGAALTLSSLSVSTGAGFAYDLSTAPALITAETYNGALTFALSNVGAGTYDLFQAAAGIQKDSISLINAETDAAIVSGGRRTVDLTVSDTGLVQVAVSLSNNLNDLVWETADTDNEWAIGGGANWTSAIAGADQQFYNGDEVAFNGTGEEITIVGTVQPAAITVSGTGYSLVGDGSIGGSGKLTVATGGEITIGTANTYTGGTEIATGGKLTMTHNQALGGSKGAPGAITGAGTLVVHVGSGNFVYATSENEVSNLGGFTGTVDIESGKLQIGSIAANGASLKGTQFGAAKVIVRNGAALNTHFGAGGGINDTSRATFESALDMMAGSTLYNIDGHVQYTGAVRFNIVDPAAATASYDAAGVVRMDQYYQKNMDFTGKISGDGTVELCNPSAENGRAVYRITGADNDFCGTYKVVDDAADANKYVELRLGSQTAAQYADINLASTASTGYLILDSDATINGLYGGGAVQAQGENRTLTVTEGDYSGILCNHSPQGEAVCQLSLTKQGAADTTLVLRGANTYTGATTINGGALILAAGATLGTTEITVNAAGELGVEAGTYTNTIKGSGTIYKDTAAASTLSGVGAEFTGRIYVADGSLNVGAALEISGDRTLSSLMKNAATLTSALTLGDGTLELDYVDAAADSALSLGNSALTLAGGTKLSLLNESSQGDMLTLLAGVSSLKNADGSELVLSDANNALSNYFDVAGTDLADSTLALNNGLLQISLAKYLTWDSDLDTWGTGLQFGDETTDEFTADANVKFGALAADEESVAIDGQISVGKVLIDAGEGKTYDFISSGSIVSAESITVNSGTAAFADGTLQLTTDTTISVNDGATLRLDRNPFADLSVVDLVLNDGSTLEWGIDNTTDYSGIMTVANGSSVNLTNNAGSGITLSNDIQSEGESATFNMSGDFTLQDDTVLRGKVNIGTDSTVTLKGASAADADNYNQNFSGVGALSITSNHGIHLKGTNNYSGNTVLNNGCRLYIDTAIALSANTILTGGGNVALCDTMTLSGNHTLTGETAIGWDRVSDKTVTLSGTVAGSVKVYANNTLDLATTGVVNGTNGIDNYGTLILHQSIVTKVNQSGTVKIDGDFTWNNTNKSYTGETQVLAGSTLTTGAPLTSGAGKVQLLADTTANTVGTLVITDSTGWANKVYGAGTLVLQGNVSNLDAIVDGAATDTLARAEVGTSTTPGVLVINTAETAAAAAKITDLVVQSGSRLELNRGQSTNTLGQNLTLSGAGDTTATANSETAAALTIKGAGAKTINSNIALAGDTTVYVNGGNSAFQGGNYNSAGYTLTKTGGSRLTIETSSGKTADTSGDFIVQSGEMLLSGMGTADTKQAVGKLTLNGGAFIINNGHYSFADTDGALHVGTTNEVGFHVAANAATAVMSTAVTGSGTIKMGTYGGSGTLTLSADNSFDGTWKVVDSKWQLQLAHANAAQHATLFYDASSALKLMDGEGLTTYNVKALKSSVTGASIATESTTRHTLNITNTLTTVEDATYQGSVAGTVDVVLAGGVQKLSGALGDGSTYKVSGGTLAIASASQSGSHSFTAAGGVLDMLGYTRAAVSATAEEENDGIWNQPAPSVADTIYAVGGQVQNLNLGAGMLLTDVLTTPTAYDAADAELSTVVLGGTSAIGAGSLAFRVKDSANIIDGTAATPYRRTNTQYAAASDGTLSLVSMANREKTYLQISLLDALDVLDPTPAENSGANYRDHVLITGMAVDGTLSLSNGSADASGYFATNLSNAGSTKYELLFVKNGGLYDLVLRASGKADTLFWGNAAGGAWNDAAGADDWVLGAKDAQGAWQPTADAADFEQFDNVIFGDLTDADGAAVTSVTVNAGTVSSEGEDGATIADTVRFGSMLVDADTTNYTIDGSISGLEGNTGATLTKTGAATLTLTGANSYGGNTTITGGTVIAQNKAALSTTQVAVSDAAALVLDYAAATEADKALAASQVTLKDATLRALKDAKATLGAMTGDSNNLQAAAGTTLAVTPTTDGTGYLYINQTPEGYTGAALTGTVAMDLTNYGPYVQNGPVVKVFAGELELSGGATDVFKTNGIHVLENATMTVDGGMTLSVNGFGATDGTGTLELKNASKLEYRDNGGTIAVYPQIVSEGATLHTTVAGAVFNIKQGGLTLKGTAANAAANTTLSGGTWVLEQGAVTWDSAATGALVVAANTTVKVNDDTMKKLTVNAANAVLATAKADGSAAELSVESINVGEAAQGGRVENVNLTLTGTGSFIRGTVAGVTVNQAADATTGTVDMTTPALKFGSGIYDTSNRATLDSLTILSGKVEVPVLNYPVNVLSGEVVVNGANALLDLGGNNRLCKAGNDSAPAADILMHAGGLDRAAGYSGQIIIDDKGTAQTMKLFRVGGNTAASILLQDIETTTGVTTLTDVYRVKLADGSAFELTQNLAEGAGNLLFDFADDAPADASVSAASGATVSIGVGGVLGDVLDAGSVSYTIADKSIAPLASAVAWDATLALYNISASFGTDGKLTLSATDVPLSADDVYRSSEDNIDDGTQWAGNGTTVYADAPYASVYIDSATEIDLTQAAAGAGDGLVLSNLIGRGAGADLSIVGDGNDKVTINNNLEPADLGDAVKVNMLSFNGDITVTDTTLQLLNTVATPGAEGAGEPDTESVYQMNGALKTDADSLVELSSGILKLNGKGAKSSELLGGVLVANGKGMLQVSGDAAVGGNLDITISDSDVEDAVPDAELVSGGKLTLLDGAAVMSGFDIHGQGQGKETLSIAKDAAVMLESYSSVMDTVLELQEGAELTWVGTQAPDAAIVELDGLTGSGAIVNIVDQGGQEYADIVIIPQGNSTFSGDLSRYEGYVSVLKSEGTQTLDKVTTADAAASKLDLYSNGNLNINVAQEGGNKTLNVRDFALTKDSATTIEMNVGSDAPALTIGGVATITDEAEVTLSSNSGTVLAAGDRLLLATAVGTGAVGNLDGVSISLDTTDDAFRRLSETATLSVVGKEVLVNLSTSETNRYADAVSDENALAGAELLWPVNPGELDKDSALKAADQAVADLLKAGNKAEAERVLAAVAGSSTAVLGSAFSADVERQLRAIRNRTTTMGVGQCEVNEGMPYVNAWINAEGDHRELSADGLAAGYTLDSWGGTVGFDMDLTPSLTVGMAVTAMYGDIDADAPDRAEGDFDTQYVSLFARVAHQAWVHTFVATLGRADASLNRTVSYGNGAYKTTGDTDGMGYGLMYEVARTFALSEDGSTCWQPVFNVAWRHSALDAYTEKGGDAALEVGEQEMNVLTLGIGARLQSVVGENIYNRASVFEARALVKFDAGDRQGEADVALIGGANSATVKAAEVGAVGVEVGAGLTIPMGMQSGSVFIDGSAELRSGYTNFNGTVGYRFNF